MTDSGANTIGLDGLHGMILYSLERGIEAVDFPGGIKGWELAVHPSTQKSIQSDPRWNEWARPWPTRRMTIGYTAPPEFAMIYESQGYLLVDPDTGYAIELVVPIGTAEELELAERE